MATETHGENGGISLFVRSSSVWLGPPGILLNFSRYPFALPVRKSDRIGAARARRISSSSRLKTAS